MRFLRTTVFALVLAFAVSSGSMAQGNDPKKIREEILDTVFNTFLRESNKGINPTDCFLRMVKSGIGACDKYARLYITQEDFEELEFSRFGISVFGVGTRFVSKDKRIVLVPWKGLPAAEAGIRAGDILFKVDSVFIVEGTSFDRASELIRGPDGTEVNITVLRNGIEVGPFKIKRVRIQIPILVSGMVTSAIGIIKINQFTERFPIELDSAPDDLISGGARGLIFDLRDNPGGMLEGTLIGFASSFSRRYGDTLVALIKKDSIDWMVSRTEGAYKDLPLVVLTNGHSASAAEIFAGLLEEFDSALVVGDTTFGKGSVQSTFMRRTSEGIPFAFKLTIAEYYLGNSRRKIDGVGIAPDYFVNDSPVVEDFEGPLPDLNSPTIDQKHDSQLKKAVKVLKEVMKKKKIEK